MLFPPPTLPQRVRSLSRRSTRARRATTRTARATTKRRKVTNFKRKRKSKRTNLPLQSSSPWFLPIRPRPRPSGQNQQGDVPRPPQPHNLILSFIHFIFLYFYTFYIFIHFIFIIFILYNKERRNYPLSCLSVSLIIRTRCSSLRYRLIMS